MFLLPLSTVQAHESESLEQQKKTATLFYGIAQGSLETIQYALKEGASINAHYGEHGDTPLIYATRVLTDLVSKHRQHIYADPVTFQSAYQKRLAIIRFLAFYPDARLNAENHESETALDLANKANLDDVLSILVLKLQTTALFNTQESDIYLAQLEALNLPETIEQRVREEIEKLSRNMSAHEAPKQHEFLKFLFSLPWNTTTDAAPTLGEVRESLDRDHHGIQKAKNKILEHLATQQFSDHTKPQILCFSGPPGTGKTTLARSIARGLGKKFERVALGGVHEESAIRGFQKTYIGSQPGNILKALKAAGTNNPVILLDEVDKLARENSWHGDPAAALLEVLDPEQNSQFVDHYLDVPFDLSQVTFIATANNIYDIDPVLLDRMEIVEFNSYTLDEKIHIAAHHIIPKVLRETGMGEKGLVLDKATLKHIIEHYAIEPGVRKLEEQMRTICSKAALQLAEQGTLPTLTPNNLVPFLGVGYNPDLEQAYIQKSRVGVVNGLIVIPSLGFGNVKTFEVQKSSGKGQLHITGNMINTCLDSAHVSMNFIKSHIDIFGVDRDAIQNYDWYIHAPSAATKDGNSAGVAMTVAIASALTNRPVNNTFAMTGEVTLTGRVFPIGGVKEKILGAERIGITKIILPEANRQDVEECKEDLSDNIELFFVDDVRQVFDLVLLEQEV